jgi:hypothetical protein
MSANLLLSRTSFHTVTIQPGEKEQSMHTDDGLINLPRPRPLIGIVSPLLNSTLEMNVENYTDI